MSKRRITKFPLAFTTKKKKKSESTIFDQVHFETHKYEQDKNIIQTDLSKDLMTLINSSNTEGSFQKARKAQEPPLAILSSLKLQRPSFSNFSSRRDNCCINRSLAKRSS